MRIAVVSQWYDPETGSAGVPASIARSLVRLGHEVEVVTGFPNYPHGRLYDGYRMQWRTREVRDGVRVTRVPLYPSHEAHALRRMLSYVSFAVSAAVLGWSTLRRAQVVLVYSTPATVVLPAWVARWTTGRPYVLLVQDLWPDTVTASGFLPSWATRVAERLLHPLCDLAYRQATSVAVTAPGMVGRIAGRGVTRTQPVLVPNWADEDVFAPRKPRADVVAAHAPWRRFTAMYAGSLGEVQGVDVLVEAAQHLRHRDDVEIVIVGTGVLEDRLKKRVADLGLANVRFLGQQPLERMPDLIGRSDAQIVTLRDLPLFRLTLPSKVQAALAMGKPVVAAVAGDAAQLLEQSGGAVVVQPGDAPAVAQAIESLADASPERLRAMSKSGRHYYEQRLSERSGSAAIDRLLQEAVS